MQSYTPQTIVIAEVVKKDNMSFICLINGTENKGFISAYDQQKYGLSVEQYNQISEGNKLECKVINYDFDHQKFQLQYLSIYSF